MESRVVGRRVRGLLAGAAAGLLTLAILTAASTTATAAGPALTETEQEMVIPATIEVLPGVNPCTGEPVVLQGHLFTLVHLTLNATHLTVTEQTKTQGVS